jgi:hypothetical protein
MRHIKTLHRQASQLTLNGYGEARELPAISLPKLVFMADPDNPKEAAERMVTMRTIRAGRDAWEEIGRAESFESWKLIGGALAIGKHHALKITGANAAWGRNYSREFGLWMRAQGFGQMAKSVRSVAIELHENAPAIEAWRAALSDKQRRRLVHPLSNVRRWRASVNYRNGKCPQDIKRDAIAAWRKFCDCVATMPPDLARPLWEAAQAQASTCLNDCSSSLSKPGGLPSCCDCPGVE